MTYLNLYPKHVERQSVRKLLAIVVKLLCLRSTCLKYNFDISFYNTETHPQCFVVIDNEKTEPVFKFREQSS